MKKINIYTEKLAKAKEPALLTLLLRQQFSDIFKVLPNPPPNVNYVFSFIVFSCNLKSQFFITAHFEKLVYATPFPSYL